MVTNENEIRTAIDNARLTTRLAVIGWIFSLAMLVVTAVLNAYRGGNVFGLAVIPFGLATLFGLAAMIYGMLATAAAQEKSCLPGAEQIPTHWILKKMCASLPADHLKITANMRPMF